MPPNRIHRYLKHGTLVQLVVFEGVARLGNFTRASEELHMAQPTVSVQIKKLTDTIGLPLFDQVRRMQLAVSTTGQYLASRLLAAFVQQHPGIDVVLQIHNRQVLRERFNANVDDLYIFADPPQTDDVVIQKILPNPMAAFAHAGHPLAREKRIPFERFAREPFLIRESGSGTRMVTLQLFEKYGLKPRIRMELSANEAIKEAILAGLGVSIMSRHTLGLDAPPAELTILDVEGLPIESHWYLAYPLGKQPSVVARSFMDFVRERAPQLVPG
jgi:DNA-binding transcriptional LysR family regulator